MATQMGSTDMASWRQIMRLGVLRGGALVAAAFLAVLALFSLLAIASYSPSDRAFNSDAAGVSHNWMGETGAYLADGALFALGAPVVGLIPLLLIFARRLWADMEQPHWKRQLLVAMLAIWVMGSSLSLGFGDGTIGLPAGWGGLPGLLTAQGLAAVTNVAPAEWRGAATFVIASGGIIGGLWTLVHSWHLDRPLLRFKIPPLPNLRLSPSAALRDTDEPAADPQPAVAEKRGEATPRKAVEQEHRAPPEITERAEAPAKAAFTTTARQGDFFGPYVLPSIDLLDPPPETGVKKIDKAGLERNARLLESVLDDFSVKGEVKAVRPGPVVTMYELEPAPGTKAVRVMNLAEDIARNMSALSARISTIPGRTVMGIELPNAEREAVSFHEMIGSSAFADQKGQLPIILGKNISGDPVIADLAPMPHLLVAGTTGSGKSVGLNCMILSLLYRLTPEQCRMIMIDPKMLELSIYDDIPHLLSPVVTEPSKAVRALKWAVEQMEDRYRMMSSISVRNLTNFNEKVNAAKAKGQPLGRRVQVGYDPSTGQPEYAEEQHNYEPLPHIVVIVDELADLMMTAGKEVEFLIQRLAQKARAAGIHLIMATQRPSVDVITGVIKANLPTRISFHVTSKIDSRTILGEQGAEQLLGKGDMLYMAGGKQITRIHGPFVSDDEVRYVADHWRGQGQPDYIQAVTEEPDDGSFALDGIDPDDSPEEQQYRQACQYVFSSQKASTSWLQRQMRIGYNTAARLIERMEEDGYITAPNHVGRRDVLRDQNGEPI